MEAHVEEHILRASSHGFELLPTRGANPSALDTPPAEKALILTVLIGNSNTTDQTAQILHKAPPSKRVGAGPNSSQRPSYMCLHLFPPQSPLS